MTKFIYTFKVLKNDIDINEHVHNVVYLSWMIQAATRHSDFLGFGHDVCLKLGGRWVTKSHHIEYKQPSFENDTLQMETWIEESGKIIAIRHCKITRVSDNMLICEGKTEWVFVDNKYKKPMFIPQEIIESFS